MLKQLGTTALLLSLSLTANAADDNFADVKINDQASIVSYGLGLNIGNGLRSQGLEDINVNALAAGVSDSVQQKPLRVSEEELNKAFNNLQEKYKAAQAEEAKQNLLASKNFLEKNKKMDGVRTTDSGLQYKIIKEGNGPSPKKTDIVTVHYRGTLIDGTEFDSSYARKQPAEFGVTQVIPGWTEALQIMKVGSKWELFIPAELAYGERSPSPAIPPNSLLIFDVELLGIKDPADSKKAKD